MWSVGCIMGELLLQAPLFAGGTEMEQLTLISKIMGTPSEKNMPGTFKALNLCALHPVIWHVKSFIRSNASIEIELWLCKFGGRYCRHDFTLHPTPYSSTSKLRIFQIFIG